MGAKFTWFEKFSATLEKIPEDERGAFALAMIEYGVHQKEPSFGFPYDAIFESVREDIDNSRKARTENKGGRPKGSRSATANADGIGFRADKKPSEENQKPPFLETETPVSEVGNPNHTNTDHTNTDHTNTDQCGNGARRKRFAPPTVAEVEAYASEYAAAHGGSLDAERFCDHYASKGWRIGSSPMKDWKAAVRNWMRDNGRRPSCASEGDRGSAKEVWIGNPFRDTFFRD